MIGIYKIFNNLNSKVYIGCSINLSKRWRDHKANYKNKNSESFNKSLYKAMRKYGLNNFKFEVIEHCNKEDLFQKEKYWINYFDSYHNGYNKTFGGEGTIGESNRSAILTENDVVNIRTEYANGSFKRDVYKSYQNKISYSGFEQVWKGQSWKYIMPEVYTLENKQKQMNNIGKQLTKEKPIKTKKKQKGNITTNKVTPETVKTIRQRHKNGEKSIQIFQDYKHILCHSSFRRIITYKTWKDVIV